MFRLLVFLPLLTSSPPGYKHVGGSHGVEVFRQLKSPTIDLFAQGEVAAPPEVVRDVLLDYPNATKLTDNVAESRVLSQNAHEIYAYQRLKLPIISDRDYTLRATWENHGPVVLTHFIVDNNRGPGPRDGVVRVSLLRGTWELQPTNGGASTWARYHMQIDLAGSVPKWLVSGGAAKNIPKVFEGLRRMSRERAPGTSVAGSTRAVH
jgi:hypothetical protein